MNATTLLILSLLMGIFISLNGSVIGTFATFIATKIGKKASANSVAGIGLLTLLYLAMILIIVSFVIATFVELLTADYQQALLICVPLSTVMISLGLIRRYFWHEPLVKITHTKQVALWFGTKTTTILQPLLLALTLVYIVLPLYITSALLLQLLALLINEVALFWVVPFAAGFIIPLYGILALVSTKTKVSKILLWKEKTKATMYLYCGFSLLLLAWIVLYITIQQGGIK